MTDDIDLAIAIPPHLATAYALVDLEVQAAINAEEANEK